MTPDQVNAAIAAARSAAAGVGAPPAISPAQTAMTVATPVAPGRAVSMREMIQESAVSVDAYLKVKDAGFTIGDDVKTFFDDIKVRFVFSAAKPFYGLRYAVGASTKYERSFDRIVNARSKKAWAACIEEAQAIDPKCRGDYRSLDVAFTSIETLLAKDGKTVLIEAGGTLGWTAAVTNWKKWVEFAEPYLKLMDAGVITDDVTLEGTIVHEGASNKENSWGLLTFSQDFQVVSADGQDTQ